MAEVARREGVSDMSLANWRRKARAEGNAVSENTPSAQNWTAETQFAVVLETAGLSEIELGEYCRRKGLYPEQIKAWRQACINGQKADKAQQKDDREQAARTRNASKNLSANCAAKIRRWLKPPRCWCCEKSSTTIGGSTTRTTDRVAGAAVTRDLVE